MGLATSGQWRPRPAARCQIIIGKATLITQIYRHVIILKLCTSTINMLCNIFEVSALIKSLSFMLEFEPELVPFRVRISQQNLEY